MASAGGAPRGSTLAARVLSGFLLALAAFAGVSGYGIYKLDRFQNDLELVAGTYVKLRIAVTRIQSEHAELTLATSVTAPPGLANALRDLRGLELRDVQLAQKAATDALSAGRLPVEDRSFLEGVAGRLEALRELCVASSGAFSAVLELPVAAAGGGAQTAARQELERDFRGQKGVIGKLDQSLQERIVLSAQRLRQEEIAALRRAGALTALMLVLGLAVALSAHFALRSLGRLGASAREIAHGDYRQRVDERGPADVAALAREFNKMAAGLEEREQRLIRSERLAAVGRIAAQITHEVRNPLSSIGLNAELLEEEVARLGAESAGAGPGPSPSPGNDDEARRLCRAITREIDRLTTITEEYLRLARLPRPRLEREDLNPLVGALLDFLRGELTGAGIVVKTELAADLPPVAADEDQLRQALLNLLRNAREAMPGGGTLRVSTRRVAGGDGAGAVEILVSDTGSGIAPAHLERIFDPFFSTKEGGTGLGLALTQQIVVEHGGAVSVASRAGEGQGHGTTFTVRLPALRAAGSGEPLAPPVPGAEGGGARETPPETPAGDGVLAEAGLGRLR